MNIYSVNIIRLSLKAHSFDYHLDEAFFKQYGTELLSCGDFEAKVVLNKHETFIEADFSIKGTANLVCDRSLEPFQHPLALKRKMMFKYGEEAGEINDEVTVITRDQASIELGQLMYEFIGIQLPMKRLHPRFRDSEEEDQATEGKIVYSSSDNGGDDEPMDPRWEALKKLK